MEVVKDKNLLKEKSEKVKEFSTIRKDMYNIEKFLKSKKNGVGLAAIQIGINKKIIAYKKDKIVRFLVNPEITQTEGLQTVWECCLSFPEVYGNIDRPERLVVKYQDSYGISKSEEFEGFLAAVIQHEVDHTNGVVCIDLFKETRKRKNV